MLKDRYSNISKKFLKEYDYKEDEKILWTYDREYSFLSLILANLYLYLGGFILFFVISTVHFFNYNILSVILIILSIILYLWWTNSPYSGTYGGYSTNNIIITNHRVAIYIPNPDSSDFYVSDLMDFEELEITNMKDNNYTMFNVKSKTYRFFLDKILQKKLSNFNIFLNEEGLNILIKLLKEKAPNCKITL